MYFDASYITESETRDAVESVLSSLDLQKGSSAREKTGQNLLLVGDLHALSSEATRHSLLKLRSGRFGDVCVVALMRTEKDASSLSSPDVSMRLADGRILLCEVKSRGSTAERRRDTRRTLEQYFKDLLPMMSPDTLRQVEFSKADATLWLRFGDGLRRSVAWKSLPFSERSPALRPSSASVTHHGSALLFLDASGKEVTVDSILLRTLVDPRRRAAVQRQASASAAGIGQQLRSLRRARKMSQAQLAARGPLAQESISRIESGARLPRLDTLKKYALGLGLSLQQLLAHLRTEDAVV